MPKKPLNLEIIASNLDEAREELEKLHLQARNGTLHEAELQVGLLHAYHHMNFVWNARRVETSTHAHLTQRQFNKWGKYPVRIEKL
jgi:hypothetical protein